MDALQQLRDRVLRDVQACIGCNDCMLACPIEARSGVTIAELNEATLAATVDRPNVRDFVLACTQCRQCVAVCPADLSRADMVLSNKLKAEDTALDRPIAMMVRDHRGETALPSTWTIDALTAELVRYPLLAGVRGEDVRRLVLHGTLRGLEEGEVVHEPGEFHERLYLVVGGAVERRAVGPKGESLHLLTIREGGFFGETAILTDSASPWGSVARERSEVLAVPKAVVRRLIETSTPFAALMDALHRARTSEVVAETAALLADFPSAARAELLEAAQLVNVAAGHTIYAQGDRCDAAYLIRDGFLEVTRRSDEGTRVMTYLRAGDEFGGLCFQHGYESEGTITATTACHLLRIPVEALSAALLRHPNVRRSLLQRLVPEHGPIPAGAGRSARSTTQLSLGLSAMMSKGLIKGHQVLVIDQTLCTDCNGCVDACGQRHGYARLERRGLQLDQYLFPAACRHCDDPVCLLCSVNGITRRPSGEITIDPEGPCIGCGACAERCPYGNIKMHVRRDDPPARRTFFRRLLDLVKLPPGPGGAGTATVETQRGGDGPRLAVKCDLCAGHEDQACVSACPVGAAFRIDPTTVFGAAMVLEGDRPDEPT